ncbi:lytic transglycosylase domain-containing protein [Burkholderia metallica]|uniref:lytic transglycosylase domain-containing protein n=1 Tax=Burkholderia metallica TaxID=488729 RepID=UPI001CF292AC|nr:lytic transglycosylase domain-containing protein [Burkholderia metallica]MCA8003455.1 lytic transglycosylase domain-containing protein [Burkholderia metallica]
MRIVCVSFMILSVCAVQSARADCFDDAGAWQNVNPLILRAIAWQESRNNSQATHANVNGSTDYGVMQINSIHLPELAQYGIKRDALMVPCKNVYIAAWHLRKQILRYGNTWTAVGAYHSSTPALRDDYAHRIASIVENWRINPAQPGRVTEPSLVEH